MRPDVGNGTLQGSSLIAFPRLRAWRAERRWNRRRREMIDRAESEGWTTNEISKALRDLARLREQERSYA